MRQPGHAENKLELYNQLAVMWAYSPAKPMVDAETCYENHPIMTGNWQNTGRRYGQFEVRRAAWWNVLSGSIGETYGAHGVWQMHKQGFPTIFAPNGYWYNDIGLPGSSQMQHIRKLMESRPFLRMVPDQPLLKNQASGGLNRILAMRDSQGYCAIVYIPSGTTVGLNMGRLSQGDYRASWFDPRTGRTHSSFTFARDAAPQFVPPSTNTDWVLVIDRTACNYKLF